MADNGEADSRIDGAALTMAQTFGAVALPAGISSAKAAAIESAATFARMLPGAENFMIAGQGNAPGVKSQSEREEDETRDALEFFGRLAEKKERELEREEWARESHAFAGVTMTGAEWGNLSKRLRDDEEFRQRLSEIYMARGMSKGEADAHISRVADLSEIMATPVSQRTEAQAEMLEKAAADPAVARDMRDAGILEERAAAQSTLEKSPGQSPEGRASDASASPAMRVSVTNSPVI